MVPRKVLSSKAERRKDRRRRRVSFPLFLLFGWEFSGLNKVCISYIRTLGSPKLSLGPLRFYGLLFPLFLNPSQSRNTLRSSVLPHSSCAPMEGSPRPPPSTTCPASRPSSHLGCCPPHAAVSYIPWTSAPLRTKNTSSPSLNAL